MGSKWICPGQMIATFHTTYANAVDPAFASSGQTITAFERNISQHCWSQHVARVWPPCCDMLGVENRTSAQHWSPNLAKRLTTSCNIQKCCMKNLTNFRFQPTTPNMLQHVATSLGGSLGWPTATCCDMLSHGCVEMLLSFDQGLRFAHHISCEHKVLIFLFYF